MNSRVLILRHRPWHEPTPAQAEAGNYRKKPVSWNGLAITVENPAGSVRSGIDPSGAPWETRMLFDYGYIRGSLGTDGDHVDCYLGPNPNAPTVFVVHQRKAGRWSEDDEDKCMLGFDSEDDARVAFLAHYNDPRFLGEITAMPVPVFIRKVRATANAPAMIKAAEPVLLFLKATSWHTITVPLYVKKDGTVVPAHTKQVHYDPAHSHLAIANGGVTHSQKKAHAQLSKEPHFNQLSGAQKGALVLSLATDLQLAANDSAAVSGWLKGATAGKNPTAGQWEAFYKLPKDKQQNLLDKVGTETGGIYSHLSAPTIAVPPEKAAAIEAAASAEPEIEHLTPAPGWLSAVYDVVVPSAGDDPHQLAELYEDAGHALKAGVIEHGPSFLDAHVELDRESGIAVVNAPKLGLKAPAGVESSVPYLIASPGSKSLRKAKLAQVIAHLKMALETPESVAKPKAHTLSGQQVSENLDAAIAGKPIPHLLYPNNAATPDTGPKEGDTKPGSKGSTLIFKDGRWHVWKMGPKQAEAVGASVGAELAAKKQADAGTMSYGHSLADASENGWTYVPDHVGNEDHPTIEYHLPNDGGTLAVVKDDAGVYLVGFNSPDGFWTTVAQTDNAGFAASTLETLAANKGAPPPPHSVLAAMHPDMGHDLTGSGAPTKPKFPSFTQSAAGKACSTLAMHAGMFSTNPEALIDWKKKPEVAKALGLAGAQYKMLQRYVDKMLAFAVHSKAGQLGASSAEVSPSGHVIYTIKDAAQPAASDWTYSASEMGLSGCPALTFDIPGSGAMAYIAYGDGMYQAGVIDERGNPEVNEDYANPHKALDYIAGYLSNHPGSSMPTLAQVKQLAANGGHADEVHEVPSLSPADLPLAGFSDIDKNRALISGWKAALSSGMTPTLEQHEAWLKLSMAEKNAASEEVVSSGQSIGAMHAKLGQLNQDYDTKHGHGAAAQLVTGALPVSPKDGDTKAAKDGTTLVFKDGHWHREQVAVPDEPAPATQKITVSQHIYHCVNEKSNKFWAVHVVGDKMVTTYGKIGTKGSVTEKQFGSHPAAYAAMQTLKAEKVAKGYEIYGTKSITVDGPVPVQIAAKMVIPASSSAQTPGPTVNVTKAPGSLITPMIGWVNVGPQQGSNPGGMFKDKSGQQWYCKFPKNADAARNELLAAKFYQMLGVAVPSLKLVEKDGKLGIASKFVPGLTKVSEDHLSKTGGVLDAFAIDAFLGNWDVIGLSNDNLMVGPDGKAMHVDVGGSLLFRAQAGKKGEEFGPDVIELATMLDPKKNAKTAAVFGGIKPKDMKWGAGQLAKLKDSQIRKLVETFGPGDEKAKAKLTETLIARRADVLKKTGTPDPWNQPALDETKLKVKPGDLPTIHDFANWNGEGKGLSSSAYFNTENAKAEQAIMDAAMKGNLVALKAYKYMAVNKETGEELGLKPISEHPSQHVQAFWSEAVSALDQIAHPSVEGLTMPGIGGSLGEISDAAGFFNFGESIDTVSADKRFGFWLKLSHADDILTIAPKAVTFTLGQLLPKVKTWYSGLCSLTKALISGIQGSGSYNNPFRDGKDKTGDGYSTHKMVAQSYADAAAMPDLPEGTEIYKWLGIPQAMQDMFLKAAPGTILQNPGSMCCSIHPTQTMGFGSHRMKIRYAKGAKALGSFGSGSFQSSEQEMTTLTGARFVVLSVTKGNPKTDKGLDIELLMLPPAAGYVQEVTKKASMIKALLLFVGIGK